MPPVFYTDSLRLWKQQNADGKAIENLMDEKIITVEEENTPKNHNKRNVVIAVVVTAVITSMLTNIIRDNFYVPISSRVNDFLNKLYHIDNVLEKKYLYDIDEDAIVDKAIAAYVEGLDEPYTQYYSAEEFESYMTGLQDSYVGVGIVIYKNDYNEIEVYHNGK